MIRQILLSAAALAAAAPALAGPTAGVEDPYGARLIAKGRTAQAEARLETAFRKGVREPEVLLNLAAIRMTQRQPAAAQELYGLVLRQPNADMATLKGNAWSHEIARLAMAHTEVAANW
jgi:Tfp pilus assembly protein PilF